MHCNYAEWRHFLKQHTACTTNLFPLYNQQTCCVLWVCWIWFVYYPAAGQSSGHTHMNYQVFTAQAMRNSMGWWSVCFVINLMRTRVSSAQTQMQSKWPAPPTSPLCLSVSTDCAAERSCPRSSASSPSQSTSSHTLSTAKSKGSLRRQSKSMVWHPLLCMSWFMSICCPLTWQIYIIYILDIELTVKINKLI